eukprot:6951771-Pyramimonas_sp.AAC.1
MAQIAQAGSRWLPRCSKRSQDRSKTAPNSHGASQASLLFDYACLFLSPPSTLMSITGTPPFGYGEQQEPHPLHKGNKGRKTNDAFLLP